MLLPAGQMAPRGVGGAGEVEPPEQRLRVEWVRIQRGIETQRLARPDGGVDARCAGAAGLRHHADLGAQCIVLVDRVETEDADRARVGSAEAGADLDRRGLPRAVGAEDRGDGARGSR